MLTENVEETPALPVGEPAAEADKVESFEAAINDAKKDLADEIKAQTKRPRGRPRKEHLKIAEPDPIPVQNPEPMEKMDFKPFIKQSMKVPFNLWALRAECEALKLTDEEAETPATYADAMLNYYAPRMESMDPGKTALIMFTLSMLMLVGEKSTALEMHKGAPKKVEKSGSTEPAKPAEPVSFPDGVLFRSTERARM